MDLSRLLASIVVAAASFVVAAQEQAFTNRATELKDRGAAEAKTLTSLPENTAVKVLQRGGGWTRVDASGQSGWVRAFHLRFPAAVEAKSSGGGGSLLGGLFGGPRTQQATVATTGIRGLTEEDFKNASPDPEALRRMQSYRVDRAAAERFAREAKLVSVSINYLMDEATTPRGRR